MMEKLYEILKKRDVHRIYEVYVDNSYVRSRIPDYRVVKFREYPEHLDFIIEGASTVYRLMWFPDIDGEEWTGFGLGRNRIVLYPIPLSFQFGGYAAEKFGVPVNDWEFNVCVFAVYSFLRDMLESKDKGQHKD